jgi:SHS2 domain-containing protein
VGTYEFFDHTGDYGVDLWADSAAEVFEVFARAYLDLFTGDPTSVGELEELEIEVDGFDREDQLVALGNELIYRFDAEAFLCARLEVTKLDEDGFVATAHGERYDAASHPIARPVKAVTHHEVAFEIAEDKPSGWHARIVFDL